jgi:hypothetical protein
MKNKIPINNFPPPLPELLINFIIDHAQGNSNNLPNKWFYRNSIRLAMPIINKRKQFVM